MVIDSDIIGKSKLLNRVFVFNILKIGLIIMFMINRGKMVGKWIL